MEDSRAATASETDPGEGDQIPHDDPLQWHSSGAGRRSHARDLTLVTGNGRLWRGQAGCNLQSVACTALQFSVIGGLCSLLSAR